MDLRRVRQFEERLSRNQAIGAVEISAKTNPRLLDKTDREGLIDNEALRDFQSLIQGALTQFEAERYPDRHNLKEVTGRLKDRETDRTRFAQTTAFLSKAIMEQPKLDSAVKLQFTKLISEARESFDSMLAEQEQPLLMAASIGLTYMMPTHEVRRDIHEALKILRGARDSKEVSFDKIDSAITFLRQADSTVGGIGRLMQRTREEEVFELERPAKLAVQLMRYRMERNLISCDLEVRNATNVAGSDRLVTMLLLNFLDNSIYWLLRNRPEQRKIKIIVDSKDSECILVVSDSGPGFGEDDIETVTLPFFTRKPNGMGLGLYIADRIARMNRGRLKLLNANDLPGLLPGANIAAFFPKAKK